MSTILKALRRLEQEKSTRSDRSLNEAVLNVPPAYTARSSRRLVVGGSLAFVFALAVTLFLIFRPGGDAQPPDSVEVAGTSPERSIDARRREAAAARAARNREAAAARTARNREPAAAPAAPRSRHESPSRATGPERRTARHADPEDPSGLPPEALTSEVKVTELARREKANEERVDAEERIRRAAAVAGEKLEQMRIAGLDVPPKAAPDARRAAESEAEPAELEPPRGAVPEAAPTAVERIAVAPKSPEPLPPPTPRSEPPPPRTERPAAEPAQIARASLPAVHVERTVWHPDADRRVTVITLEGSDEVFELHEGDAVGTLVVGTIEPSGVSFYREGAEFRRRVGER